MKRRLTYPRSRPETNTHLFVCDSCGAAIWHDSKEAPVCVVPVCQRMTTKVRKAKKDELAAAEIALDPQRMAA